MLGQRPRCDGVYLLALNDIAQVSEFASLGHAQWGEFAHLYDNDYFLRDTSWAASFSVVLMDDKEERTLWPSAMASW